MFKYFKTYRFGGIIIGGIFLTLQFGLAQEVDYQQQLKQVSQQLVCLCGCGNMILDTCSCGEAKKNKEFILAQLKAGKSQPEILDMMVNRYGEQVLAAPKREGINWVIWVVVPYIVPLLGAIGVAFLIMRWVRRRQIPAPQQLAAIPGTAGATSADKTGAEYAEYKQKLEEELKDFE